MSKSIGSLILGVLFVFAFLIFSFKQISAQQGCCSWHGGISYCDAFVGRYVCNDGTYSPSCGCVAVPPLPLNTNNNLNWCGYGAWFTTQKMAQNDLDTAYKNIFQKGRDSGFEACHQQEQEAASGRTVLITMGALFVFLVGFFIGRGKRNKD